MRKYLFLFIFLTVSSFLSISLKAQVYQLTFNSSNNLLSGDFTSTDINSESSGFATYAYGGNLDFKFYAQEFGFGARVIYNSVNFGLGFNISIGKGLDK